VSIVSVYFLGRCHPRWLLLTWVVTFLVAVLTWNEGIEVPGSPNGALVSARLTVPLIGLVIHLWLIAPAMATWEAVGVQRVRTMTAMWVAGGVLLASAVVLTTIWFVTKAPAPIVPGHFIGVDDLLSIQWPLAQNILVLAGIASLFVCIFGRSLGTAATVLTYITFVIGGANTEWYHLFPYFSHGFGIPVTQHPIAATLLPVVAVWAWARTGGSSAMARKLDPR
jgi:hypothetical protein